MARPAKRSVVLPSSRRRTQEPEPLPETISSWTDFYAIVLKIPRGRVCTYGAIAAMAGHPRSARHVGFALAALKEGSEKRKNRAVPWQRVLGRKSRGRAAITIKDPVGGALQRMMLESEGVEFDARGHVSLENFGWFQASVKKVASKTRVSSARPLPSGTTKRR